MSTLGRVPQRGGIRDARRYFVPRRAESGAKRSISLEITSLTWECSILMLRRQSVKEMPALTTATARLRADRLSMRIIARNNLRNTFGRRRSVFRSRAGE
jgi:hypothetical protein